MGKLIDLFKLTFGKDVMEKVDMPDDEVWGAIMLPVLGTDDFGVEDPPVTVVYFGDHVDTLPYDGEDVAELIQDIHLGYLGGRFDELDWFGEDNSVPVLRVEHDLLYRYRMDLVELLTNHNMMPPETYPTYKPHVSISLELANSGRYPQTYILGLPEVWWGNEHIRVF